MVFDKFDPTIWIPTQRLLEMSKWVGQGAEAASLIIILGNIHTHRPLIYCFFRKYTRLMSGFGPRLLTGVPSKLTSKRVVRRPPSWKTFSSNIGLVNATDIQPWMRR